jgi:tellurite resistance protein
MNPKPIDATDSERVEVEQDRAELRDFIKGLDPKDIASGNWFTKLLAHALDSYTEKVDAEWFKAKYPGVPSDAIVDQRIKIAARYAAIEGGLSAGAYSAAAMAAVLAPVTLPAAAASVLLDVAYTARLQIHLAYDIAVLYRVPLNLDDPDDLWKLIRVAFTIQSAQVAGEGLLKSVPAIVKPLVKAFYRGDAIKAGKALPVVGKHLLQRNVVKIGIPLVGVPLSVGINFYTTLLAGKHARAVFRNDARITEAAVRISTRTEHPQSMLWVAWMLIMADGKITDDEALLMKQLTKLANEKHGLTEEDLAHVIDIDKADIWRRLDAEDGDLLDLMDVAQKTAEIDGEINKLEEAVLEELRQRYGASGSNSES